MELNLTYEESKKILEFGYDFRSICTKFEFRENEEATTLTFLYSCGEIVTMWNPRMSEPYSYHLKSIPALGIIPLIPKAALLMSLPFFEEGLVYKYHGHLSFQIDSNFQFIHLKETCSGEVVELFLSDNENPALIKVFLWCHENYPEQLRAKFEEVMK